MARFARSNPRVELSVVCEPSPSLDSLIARGALDLALVTLSETRRRAEIVRREPLLWVTSANHSVHEEKILPMAFGRVGCVWRDAAVEALGQSGRSYRVLVTSWSATAVAAAVLSGLAVSILPECALRPGMRVLSEQDGFARLPDVKIGLLHGHATQPDIVDALARHITESLDNISVPIKAEDSGSFDFAGVAQGRMRRHRPSQIMPGW
jgi:DNA-binding transcriptional LysR family regulator